MNKKHKIIYASLLVFSFLMIMLMLFGPMLLYQLFPEVATLQVTGQWNLGATAPPATIKHYPFFVELYRHNEWIPGMLSFLAFILVVALVKKQEPKKEVVPEQPQTILSAEDEITQRIAYYDNEIMESEKREAKLLALQQQAGEPYKQTMSEMLIELKEKEQQEAACNQERDNLVSKRQLLLKEVEAELAKYRRDYREALANDPVKNTFIHPGWETETDIIHYYKVKAQ